MAYTLEQFVTDLDRITRAESDATVITERVAPLLGELVKSPETIPAEYRRSPDGVAEELYWRTRKTHPEAQRDEFRVVVNDVNALEVHLAILEAVAPKNEPGAATTPSS